MQRVPLQDNPKRHHRRSIRLAGYDYSQAGAYFVTICTQDRACLFGEIADGEMWLSNMGEIVKDEWLRTAKIRSNVELDTFVVMPNHFHGIIVLHPDGRGTLQHASTNDECVPTVEKFSKPTSNTIPTIVRLFKSATTRCINVMCNIPGVKLWQRNYYEHIIRNDESLNRIREYIVNNPLQWALDRENPVGARCNAPLPKDTPWRI